MSTRGVFLALGAVLGGAALIAGGSLLSDQPEGGSEDYYGGYSEIEDMFFGIPLVIIGLAILIVTFMFVLTPPTRNLPPPPPPPPPPPDLPQARARTVDKGDIDG